MSSDTVKLDKLVINTSDSSVVTDMNLIADHEDIQDLRWQLETCKKQLSIQSWTKRGIGHMGDKRYEYEE